MRRPMMSGFCATPQTVNPEESHARCRGGNRANPAREFQPCPCPCHLGEEFECGNCGRDLREAPLWINDDAPDEMVYVHIDKDGRALGEECAR